MTIRGFVTHPALNRLLLGQRRNATLKPTGPGQRDRGPHRRKAAKGGLSERLRGRRLAPGIGHRVDTDRGSEGPSSACGGKERVAGMHARGIGIKADLFWVNYADLLRRQGMKSQPMTSPDLVPMPPFGRGPGYAGLGVALSLPKKSGEGC